MELRVRVGCCGWVTSRTGYFKLFDTVEIQSTFYRLPRAQTAGRWRRESPPEFTLCAKAWQAITHPPTSPTWRRSGLKPEELEGRLYGFLRPTEDNFEAWELTREILEAAGVKICVIQCPASFKLTGENLSGLEEFLTAIDRGSLTLAWEPRGDWLENPGVVKRLCRKLNLIHVVDPFQSKPQHFGRGRIAYFRLHGMGRPSPYHYRYSDAELERLVELVKGLKVGEVFCMFNNVDMLEDAKRFKLKLKGE